MTRLFDLDGDGDLDVLTESAWFENYDGHGNFSEADSLPPNSGSHATAVDLNDDGRLDIVTSGGSWLEANAEGKFVVEHAWSTEEIDFETIEFFDVGGDLDIDIVAQADGSAYLFENKGGTFALSEVHLMPSNTMDVVDFNLDGRLDFLIYDRLAEEVAQQVQDDMTPRDYQLLVISIDMQTPEGGFERTTLLEEWLRAEDFPSPPWPGFFRNVSDFWTIRSVEFVDIDSDGKQDLVVREKSDEGNYLPVFWRQVIDGTVSDSPRYVGDEGHGHLIFRDVNHDGFLDVLTSEGMSEITIVSINDGHGRFAHSGTHSWYYDAEHGSERITHHDIGDIDGDGVFDVLVGIEAGYPIWHDGVNNRRHIAGEIPDTAPMSATTFVEQTSGISYSGRHAMADINGDGRLDVLSRHDGSWQWESDADGDGLFELQHPINQAGRISSPSLVDIDLDGDLDLIAVNPNAGAFAGYSVVVYTNESGAGDFSLPETVLTIPVGSSPAQVPVVVADFNGDGQQDLLLVHLSPSGIVAQLYEAREQTFVIEAENVWELGPLSTRFPEARAIDINGDGALDMAFVDTDLELLVNSGDGSFHRGTVLPNISSADFGDIDGDGQLDVATVNSHGIAVHTWEEEGLTLRFEQPYTVGFGTVKLVDIDGDLDLDASVHSSRVIDWFENDNGQFNAAVNVESDATPINDILYLDVDGDDDVDILTQQGFSWTLYETVRMGDSNGDGRFTSSDLVLAFQVGEYEDEITGNSTFVEGDWNGDGDFTSADLVLLFQLGIYEP